MSLISSKIIADNGTPVAFGGAGSPFTTYQSNVFASAGSYVLPVGDWFVVENADISVQINPSGDGSTWVTYSPASTSCFIRADGQTVRLTASAATTAYFFGPA